MTPTVDGTFTLIARIYYRALLDARRGDRQAMEWLDVVAPDWRERTKEHGNRPTKLQRNERQEADFTPILA